MTFFRYVLVQLAAYGIDMGVFVAILSLELSGPVIANIPAKILAGLFAFFLHRHFTFRLLPDERDKKQAIQYFLLLTMNVPLSSAVLSGVLVFIHSAVPAKFVADVICVLFTFWVSKTWVFKRRTRKTVRSEAHGGPP